MFGTLKSMLAYFGDKVLKEENRELREENGRLKTSNVELQDIVSDLKHRLRLKKEHISSLEDFMSNQPEFCMLTEMHRERRKNIRERIFIIASCRNKTQHEQFVSFYNKLQELGEQKKRDFYNECDEWLRHKTEPVPEDQDCWRKINFVVRSSFWNNLAEIILQRLEAELNNKKLVLEI